MKSNINHIGNTPGNTLNDSATVTIVNAPFSATLGSLLKSWRTDSNRSVYSVAKATALSAHTINRIESGRAVNLEAALRYLAFINRTDPKSHILRSYLAATKSIELTPRQPMGCLVNEVSTIDNVDESRNMKKVPAGLSKTNEPKQFTNPLARFCQILKGILPA